MAGFNYKYFGNWGSTMNKLAPQTHLYTATGDTFDKTLVSGFFDVRIGTFQVGDLIYVVGSDKAGLIVVTAVSPSVTTVVLDEEGHETEQEKIYYWGDAGLDTNTGKSEGQPFLTITAALAAAVGETPESGNQIAVHGIGSIQVPVNFEVPEWINVYAPEAILQGNVVVNDNTTITCKDSWEPSTGSPPRNFSKTSGTGTAIVNIVNYFDCGTGVGMNCTAGTLVVNTVNGSHSSGYLVGDGAGKAILNSSGLIQNAGNGFIVLAQGNGEYIVNYSNILSSSTNAVFGNGASSGKITAMGDKLETTGAGREYLFTVAGQYTHSANRVIESGTSSNTGTSTINRFINRDNDDKTIIENSIDDIELIAGGTFAIDGSDSGTILSLPTYNNTSASAANVYIDSNGKLFRSTA